MADNFLEKRYEEVFGSRSRAASGPNRPSLDSLLARVSANAAPDPSYPVNAIQAETVVKAGKTADRSGNVALDIRQEGKLQRIIPSCPASDANRDLILGEVLLAMRLKAAEIGLGSIVSYDPLSITLGKPL